MLCIQSLYTFGVLSVTCVVVLAALTADDEMKSESVTEPAVKFASVVKNSARDISPLEAVEIEQVQTVLLLLIATYIGMKLCLLTARPAV